MLCHMSQDEAVGRLRSVPRSEDHVPGREALGAAAGGGEPQTVLARLGSHVPGGEPVLPLPVRRHLPVSSPLCLRSFSSKGKLTDANESSSESESSAKLSI